MIKSFIAVVSLYSLTSSTNRLLLQQFVPAVSEPPLGVPPYTPPGNAPPAVPEPSIGVPPYVPPAAPINPGNAPSAVPEPPIGVPPYIPPAAPYTPPAGNGNGNGPAIVPGSLPIYMPDMMAPPPPPPVKLICDIPAGELGSCSLMQTTVTNVASNFEGHCSSVGSCQGSIINMVFTASADPLQTEIAGFWFTEVNSGAGLTVNIDNQRPGNKISIDRIQCDKSGSCAGATFNIGPNMEFQAGDMYCGPGACDGCTINGKSCMEFI